MCFLWSAPPTRAKYEDLKKAGFTNEELRAAGVRNEVLGKNDGVKVTKEGREGEKDEVAEVSKGKLIGDTTNLTKDELDFVKEQIDKGKEVEIIPTAKTRRPDFVIDGQRFELKTLSGVKDSSPDKLSGAIASRIMDGRGQAKDIIVNARNQAGISQEIAERGARRAFGADNKLAGKIQSIKIIGPDFEILVPRQE